MIQNYIKIELSLFMKVCKIKEYILFLNDHKIYPDENYALFYTTNQNLFH